MSNKPQPFMDPIEWLIVFVILFVLFLVIFPVRITPPRRWELKPDAEEAPTYHHVDPSVDPCRRQGYNAAAV